MEPCSGTQASEARRQAVAAIALAVGVLGFSAPQDAAFAANIRNHIESVRRDALVVYLGVVDDVELSERPPRGRLEARAQVRVLFVARSPAGESPSTATLEYPTWDEDHPPYAGDGQHQLDPGSLVVVFTDTWGGGRVRYLLKGERGELLKDLEARRGRLVEMSDEDLKFNEIGVDDRRVQLELYGRLASYLDSG